MRERKGLVLALVLSLFLVVLAYPGETVASVWATQPVDQFGDKGPENSLALDSSGHPHISYREFDWYRNISFLKYASWNGIGWHSGYIDAATEDTGFASSLAMSSSDRPSIAFHDGKLNLKYAKWGNSGWEISVIGKGGNPSLALDALDRPHVSYVIPTYYNDPYHRETDIRESDLMYAYHDGQTWRTQTVDTGGRTGEDSSLAIDANGRPHIAYRDFGVTGSLLKYATWDGATWKITVVDSLISDILDPRHVSQNISIALDGAGRPCISYMGRGYSLRYAAWDGTKWQLQVVQTQAGGYEVPNSLALDGEGRPHIIYRDYVPNALKYAVWDGSGWQIEIVDSGNVPGLSNSLKLDEKKQPHIAYYVGINGEGGGALYYAKIGSVAKVTATPAGGMYDEAQRVTLSSGNFLDVIYYTTDGSTPTRASQRYMQFYPVNIPADATTELKFFVVDSKGNEGDVQTEIYTIDTTTPVYTLTVAKGGSGSGAVAVDGAVLGTDLSETARYRSGTQLTLTPQPEFGAIFSGWSGACTGTGTCLVTMDASKNVTASFTALAAGTGFAAIAAGANHSLILNEDGAVAAWGLNGNGQLGDGTTTDRNVPTRIPGLTGVQAIAAGLGHSLALKDDGTVMAWGLNASGQVGDGSTIQRPVPTQVSGLSGVTAIAVGVAHCLALKSDGTVVAWGHNVNGQIGDGTTTNRTTPTPVAGLAGVKAIGAGSHHSLAVKSDGTVVAWGANVNGRLGDGTKVQRNTPVRVAGLSMVTAVAAGLHHSLALTSSGAVYGWGLNSSKQLGNWYLPEQTTPVAVQGLSGIAAIATGGNHSLALKSDGSLLAWGDNTDGELGNGSTSQIIGPVPVSGVSGVKSIAGGIYHSLALKEDGMALAWGLNSSGQLGDWTLEPRTAPVQVKFSISPFKVTVAGPIANGVINCTGPVSYNKESICTITPSPGYVLSSFTVNGSDRLAEVRGNSYTIGNVQRDQQVTGSFLPSAVLTLLFAGTGGGSVNGDISCSKGTTCPPTTFATNTVARLLATPDADSVFGAWNGACTVTGNSCSVVMSGARTVTATFNAAPRVRILGGAAYPLLSAAYAAAANNAVIQARAVLLEEGDFLANRPVTVRLAGGYSADFSTKFGVVVVKGRLLIRNGALRMDGVVLR